MVIVLGGWGVLACDVLGVEISPEIEKRVADG
jgi:hypothetical protein